MGPRGSLSVTEDLHEDANVNVSHFFHMELGLMAGTPPP